MSSAKRLLTVACAPVVVFIAGLWITRQVQRHPFLFRAPADASRAFSWDTATEIVGRGFCAPGPAGSDPTAAKGTLAADWRPQPGRYVLTLLVPDGRAHWRTTRGRLWLHDPAGPSAKYLLYGATDLELTNGIVSPAFASALRPRPASTDPSAPGVVVVRDSSGRTISMIIGQAAARPSSSATSRAPVVELRLTGGVSDGFWGWWRGGDSTEHRSGYFCAGWIEA